MLYSYLNELLQFDSKCVLAFSGGLDSTVLLHQLVDWHLQHPQSRLRVLHIHHGLSPNADIWAMHCQKICEKWNILCEVIYIKVVNININGIEAAARNIRYKALFQQLQPNECLLTAHHLDDQCETLLLALKRGSGPTGLAAMPLHSRINNHLHLRPLLNFSRLQLEVYANKHQLYWIEDESNKDSHYDRNFLRLEILPLLQARWPYFNRSTVRSAIICAEQEQLLNELLFKKLKKLTDNEGALYFIPLLTMSEVCRHVLLRLWISQRDGGIMPSRKALKRITKEVMCSRKDAQPCLRFMKYEIRRYQNKLYWLPQFASISENVLIWHDSCQVLCLPQNLGQLKSNSNISELRHPTQHEQVNIRFKAHGYYHLLGRKGGRKMKKIWQELGIPPWQRGRIPLIFYNDILIGAPKLFITYEGAAKDTQGWEVIWIK